MPNTDDLDLMTTSEVSEELGGVSTATIINWVKAGRIRPATRLRGHHGAYLFDRAEIEEVKAAAIYKMQIQAPPKKADRA